MIDTGSLGAWLGTAVPGEVRQLSGGSSNLTFLVETESQSLVLRRPPLSHVLATAHDMAREYRVQKALEGSGVPVPRMIAYCVDESVIGAPFYVMEALDGVVYTDADAVAHLTESQAAAATYELVDVLARLHSIDPARVGLADLGRPEGFLARQLKRWRTQWERSKQHEIPAVEEVAHRLERALPPEGTHGIVHGDYSFNNTMYERERPERMLALLDWEMATLGDPLTDVGMLVAYWGPVGELLWSGRVPQAHRANPGFPDSDALLERYTATSDRSLDHIDFYRVLATYKLAVITAGAAARLKADAPERAESALARCEALAASALDLSASFARSPRY